MKSRFLFFLFFSISTVAAAQSKISRLGRFEMDEVRGCAPLTVTIVHADLIVPLKCDAGQPCDMTWGDGSGTQQNQFTHTYTQPGTYTISILYQGADYDDIEIVVFPNTQPTFNVYNCSANGVQVQVTDTNYDAYIINYNDGTAEVEVPRGSLPVNHTFASSGSQTVSVRGINTGSADNCLPPASKPVVVALAAPPVPTLDQLVVTSNSVIDLEMTTQQNVLYRLEMSVNGGAFSNLGNLLDVNTATVPGLATDNNFYCFRLGVINPCMGSVSYSSVICSANLTVSAVNNANNLVWTTSAAGIADYTLYRDGVFLATTASTTFTDNTVNCATEYCYQVISNYASASSRSAVRCVMALSTDTPTPITSVSTVVNAGQVDLTWQPNATFQAEHYAVLRQSNGSSFGSLANGLTIRAFTDPAYDVAGQYCYRIDYKDVCGNTSDPGIVACPIILRYNINTNNDIILTWSAYTGWADGVAHYEIDKYNLQHNLLETFGAGSLLTFTDTDLTDQGYYYVVRAIPVNAANNESVSNEVNAIRSLRFAYPKAFTPDKQGPVENETFNVFVTEEFIASFEMKIFNRWGEMIFSTTNLRQGWNGEFNGEPQPEGTYTFTATLRDKTGKIHKRDGSVLLLRKK